MDLLSLIGVGIVAAVLAVVLRQEYPEYAMLVSLAAGVFLLLAAVNALCPVVNQMEDMLADTALPTEYAGILLKALGICFLTQIACDACKDAGESAIGAKVELAGKTAVLLVSLPLFEQVLTIAKSLIY